MKKILIFILPVLLIVIFACKPKGQEGTASSVINAKEKAIDSIAKNAATIKDAYMKELKAMNNEKLVMQMDKESNRGLEPFNSLAYAEAIKRGPALAENLVQMIRDTTKTSLLSLLALNTIDQKLYNRVNPAFRSAILLDALKNSKLYNAFGLPHLKTELAGEAIIKEGNNIRKGLMGLLSDTKPAPVWGSEDYAEYVKYNYRVCDYALFYLKKIEGDEKFTMPASLEERDSIIRTMSKH
jgi:hypothetical protein